ncbi:hypothetical protein [Pseudomonas oryzae]|uniref:Uncharacterized protein n=1 Tax=Pseudomonas oryzae TaxID=1392877 RepID=A0A1H1M3F1_9PSED|nr:hypothetical protein [Pseudomonas oryzae]SDR80895.1 hypothetical protein SAMN05216221_0380 [Pseudomonas oryzae]
MKIGALVCLLIFVAWVALALVQLWWAPLGGELFFKLSVTAGALFVVALAITLVVNEYATGKRQKERGYLD